MTGDLMSLSSASPMHRKRRLSVVRWRLLSGSSGRDPAGVPSVTNVLGEEHAVLRLSTSGILLLLPIAVPREAR
jgi:hypothetical protein